MHHHARMPPTTSRFKPRWPLAFLLVMSTACGSSSPSSDTKASSDPPTGNGDEDPSSGAPTGPSSGDGDAAGDSLDPTNPATIRVHYLSDKYSGSIGITGAQAPLDADDPSTMTYVGDNTWEYPYGVLASPVQVTPTLDKKKALGPAYVLHPGQTLDIYPHFHATKGDLSNYWPDFHSTVHPDPSGEQTRPIQVYLPPTYVENATARFPVIYMPDSQLVFGVHLGLADLGLSAAFGSMQVDDAIDAAAASGAFPEAIVVGIYEALKPSTDTLEMQRWRNYELTPWSWAHDPTDQITAEGSGGGASYVEMIVQELKPLADKELRTKPERENTYFSGASLGGLMSEYAGVVHGEVFGGIMSFSGSAWWDDEHITKLVAASSAPGAIEKRSLRVYASVGDDENTITPGQPDTIQLPSSERLFATYPKVGYVEGKTVFTEVVKGGTHHGDTWSKLVPKAFAAILGPGR